MFSFNGCLDFSGRSLRWIKRKENGDISFTFEVDRGETSLDFTPEAFSELLQTIKAFEKSPDGWAKTSEKGTVGKGAVVARDLILNMEDESVSICFPEDAFSDPFSIPMLQIKSNEPDGGLLALGLNQAQGKEIVRRYKLAKTFEKTADAMVTETSLSAANGTS